MKRNYLIFKENRNMRKKFSFLFISFSLLLMGSAIAHELSLCKQITKRTSSLCNTPTSRRLYTKRPYVYNFVVNFPKSVYFNQSKYQNDIDPKDYMKPDHLLLNENSSTSKTKKTKRPLKVSKICKEFILGEIMGIFFSIPGAMIGCSLGHGPTWKGIEYGLSGLYLGYILGTSVGVYIAGNDKVEKGSYLATFGGCALGTIGGVGTCLLLAQFTQSRVAIAICYGGLVFGPPIGSIIGFNLSRKARELPEEAFINYNKGRFKFSFTEIDVHYNQYYGPILNVNLFQINF